MTADTARPLCCCLVYKLQIQSDKGLITFRALSDGHKVKQGYGSSTVGDKSGAPLGIWLVV